MLDCLTASRSNAPVQPLNNAPMLDDETRYRILKRLEADPDISQRALARELGISLGKANYCLKALIERGFVKTANFRNSANKKAYLYRLTPKGLEDRTRMAIRFLRHKRVEYELLQRELQDLEQEVRRAGGRVDPE